MTKIAARLGIKPENNHGMVSHLNHEADRRDPLERSRVAGLDFRPEGHTGWTMEAMRDLKSIGAIAPDLTLEDAMGRGFALFGFFRDESEAAATVTIRTGRATAGVGEIAAPEP